jgi:hypothetical protein
MDWLKDIFGISYTEFNQLLLRFGSRLLIAALIIVIGFWIAGLLTKALRKMLNKSDIDTGLVTFLTSFFSMAFKILVLVTAIMELGIQMTSIIALLGAAGLAIGMAFSGTLSNFAGGIMILVLKPFKVGDFVDAQGVQGIVTEIQIFNTYLSTVDNKIIILPNGPTANGNIINFTKADKRRVEWIISIAYGDDVEKAKAKIQETAEATAAAQAGRSMDTSVGGQPAGMSDDELKAMEERLQKLRELGMSELELKQMQYAADQELLLAKLESDAAFQEEYNQLSVELAKRHADELTAIDQEAANRRLSIEQMERERNKMRDTVLASMNTLEEMQ